MEMQRTGAFSANELRLISSVQASTMPAGFKLLFFVLFHQWRNGIPAMPSLGRWVCVRLVHNAQNNCLTVHLVSFCNRDNGDKLHHKQNANSIVMKAVE